MLKWFRQTWGQRQLGAVADLVAATTEIMPDWQQVQIDRNGTGSLVLSVTGPTGTAVHRLSRAD